MLYSTVQYGTVPYCAGVPLKWSGLKREKKKKGGGEDWRRRRWRQSFETEASIAPPHDTAAATNTGRTPIPYPTPEPEREPAATVTTDIRKAGARRGMLGLVWFGLS